MNITIQMMSRNTAERQQRMMYSEDTQNNFAALLLAAIFHRMFGTNDDSKRDSDATRDPGGPGNPGNGPVATDKPVSRDSGTEDNGVLSNFLDFLELLDMLSGNNKTRPNSLADRLADLLGLKDDKRLSDLPADPGTTPGSPSPTADPTVGTPSTVGTVPPGTEVVVVNEPIKIPPGETFDGQGKHYVAGPGLGDGGQSEGQKPLFEMGVGSHLKNAYISGADGVHAQGDAKLTNVTWIDVGEDAFTLKGEGNVEINGGGAFDAEDKIFQLNAGGSFSLNNFHAENFGKAIRTNGGKDFPMDINVSNSTFVNGKESVVRTDASQASVNLLDNKISGTKYDVLAPDASQVKGASNVDYKPFTG